MINIIKNNIKNAWKTKKAFVILLVLVQMISAFSILFVMGAISNDYMSLKENADSNMSLWLYVKDAETHPVYYKDVEQMFFDIDERFNDIYEGIGVSFPYVYEENSCTSIFCKFSVNDGKYVINSNLEREKLSLVKGKIFTDETINSDKCYATFSKSDEQYADEHYEYNDVEIEIIGYKKNEIEGNNGLVINPATARQLNVSFTSIIFSLNRILTEDERTDLLHIVDKYMGGKYTNSLETYSNEDARAILRSTFSMSIITAAATVIVLFIIYNYFFTLRKKNYAIMQMSGCTRLKGTLILLGEMMLFSIPSILAGTIVFRFCQERWFNSIFRYMEIAITSEICINFVIYEIVVVFILFFLLSFWFSRKSVKSQLITIKE